MAHASRRREKDKKGKGSEYLTIFEINKVNM